MTQQDREKAAKLAELLKGVAEGGELQWRYEDSDKYIDREVEHLLNSAKNNAFLPNQWRVVQPAPAKTVEPWTFETCESPLKIRRKGNSKVLRGAVLPDGVHIAHSAFDTALDYSVSYADLARDFEQLDGSPCGTTKEVSEWPKWFRSESGGCVWMINEDESGILYNPYTKWTPKVSGPGAYPLSSFDCFIAIADDEAHALIGGAK